MNGQDLNLVSLPTLPYKEKDLLLDFHQKDLELLVTCYVTIAVELDGRTRVCKLEAFQLCLFPGRIFSIPLFKSGPYTQTFCYIHTRHIVML